MNEKEIINKKILLISAPIGAGHIRGAEALAQTMLSKFENVDPMICNVFDFFSPLLGKTILRVYLKILGIFPQIYSKMYDWGNESKFILLMREYISRYLAKRMAKFICGHNPALIIATHATPAGLVASLKKQGKLNVPIVAVITDYVVHRLWVYPEFDHYFVATEEMADYLKNHGIERSKIEVSGIPILPAFSQTPDKEAIYNNLGLSRTRPTVLVMGGGAGILPIDKILESLSKTDLLAKLQLQIIVVAGKNKAMYERLVAFAEKIPQPIKVCGYIENVHELMTVSDALISKPGGMTSAEALASGLPLLIYRPLPGQEEANTRYLLSRGAALLINSHSQLATSLEQILAKQPDKLADLKDKAMTASQPSASFTIVNCLKKYI